MPAVVDVRLWHHTPVSMWRPETNSAWLETSRNNFMMLYGNIKILQLVDFLPIRTNHVSTIRSERLGLLKLFAPQVPNLLFKSVGHFLALTPQSQYWDLRTTLTVEFLRSYLAQPKHAMTVEETQATTTQQLKVQPNTWKVDVELPLAEEGKTLEGIVRRAIIDLGSANIEEHIPQVSVQNLTGEWIGSRARQRGEKQENEGQDGLSEEEKYRAMMKEVEGGEESGVILWLHGGAYWLCDPSTHRSLTRKVARSIKGRIFMPRYRLAPQSPFPAALIDAFVSYLYLLYPPPGALHKPIPASKIIIAGDSAGGGLSFSLLQLLLHLHRSSEDEDGYEVIPSSTPLNSPTLYWQGEPKRVPLPGGIMGLSAWVDISRCLGERFSHPDGTKGSEEECKNWDYLPTPCEERLRIYKPSSAWPRNVKRSHLYAADALITHPLVSPITAESWKGSPPVWMSVGDECLRDSNLYFAHRLLLSDVNLQFKQFTRMPHVFQGISPHLAVSRRSFKIMSEFIDIVFGRSGKQMELGGSVVDPVSLEEIAHDMEELQLGGLQFEDLLARMREEVGDWIKNSGVVGNKGKNFEVAKL